MRDYVAIIANLRAEGTPAALEGAEALEEATTLARRMTSLGVDLEAQIQEDFTPDLFAMHDSPGELNCLYRREDIKRLCVNSHSLMLPLRVVAMKSLGESWFVLSQGELVEFFSEEEASQLQRGE